jgi:hypothetical protein
MSADPDYAIDFISLIGFRGMSNSIPALYKNAVYNLHQKTFIHNEDILLEYHLLSISSKTI